MKKLTYVLGFLFLAVVGITAYATTEMVNNDVKIATVDQNSDEKPCPAGCTCAKCEKAKSDAKATGTETKTDCNKEAKVGCDKEAKASCNKEAKKSCCAGKSDAKTDVKSEVKTEPTSEKK